MLSEDGERTRADHRHHAIDALTVACAHPGVTHQLSCYWHAKDKAGVENPNLPNPWPTIRTDATKAVNKIVVSHRVRKKVSGPLHKETTYGDTGVDVTTASGLYRQFVTRKRVEALSRSELGGDPDKGGEGIRDARVREVLQEWVRQYGGDPRKAFPSYPRIGEHGPEIRKVRLLRKQQLSLMAPVSTGYSDLGNNHHIAIYRCADDKVEFEVVSLYEASRRLARREPVVRRDRGDGSVFLMSLASGEAVEFPEGEKKGVWIVTGVWSGGQVVLEACTDAVHATTMRPRPSVLIKEKVRKVSVDPIGRVRPASD